jgi:hypothetical protein
VQTVKSVRQRNKPVRIDRGKMVYRLSSVRGDVIIRIVSSMCKYADRLCNVVPSLAR